MIWRLRRQEPSFSSMNEKSFESRRVRTQPRTCMPAMGAVLASAALTEIGPDMPATLAGDSGSTSKSEIRASLIVILSEAKRSSKTLWFSRGSDRRSTEKLEMLRQAQHDRERLRLPMGQRRLILWDIDMTLVNTGAAGRHALVRATVEWFGGEGDLSGVEIAGRTDRAIAHQILQKYGQPATEKNVDAFLDRYASLLPEELPKRNGHVLPGVRELLEDLARQPDKTLGLLTGNLERGAQL